MIKHKKLVLLYVLYVLIGNWIWICNAFSIKEFLSHPYRFIKSQYAGKRAAPGSHSSRAYIETRNSEKSDYGGKSSALSDTSEAPSLGEFMNCHYVVFLLSFSYAQIGPNFDYIYILTRSCKDVLKLYPVYTWY